MEKLLKKLLNKYKTLNNTNLKYELNHPENFEFGNYSTNFALIGAKEFKKPPHKIAEKLVTFLESDKEFKKYFTAQVAGPGFINFFLNLNGIVIEIEKNIKNKTHGKNKINKNKRILVEYAQPNPFKSFHVGHLRNIIIGESIARLMKNSGAKVIKTNYQGDVGLHVAKFFYGLKHNPKKIEDYLSNNKKTKLENKVDFMADCYVIGAKAYKKNQKAIQEILELNKKIYEKDQSILKDWEEKRKWSLEKFEQIYQTVYSKFDKLYFESEMIELGIKKSQEAYNKGILIKDHNCLIFNSEKHGLNKRVFINKIGLPTYEAKEIALAYREFTDFGNIDRALHVVASEQENFFKITFKTEKLLDPELFDNKQEHISYGMVSIKGMKMSSREGNIILGEDIIKAAKKEIKKIMLEREEQFLTKDEIEEISQTVAVGAVKYSFLKVNFKKNIVFNLKESISLEGQSGPYVMYSLVRAKSILKKAGESTKEKINHQKIKLDNPQLDLFNELLKFKEVINRTTDSYHTSNIAEYSYKIATKFSNFYDKCKVLKETDLDKKIFKLKLVKLFEITQVQCLNILGIKPLDKM